MADNPLNWMRERSLLKAAEAGDAHAVRRYLAKGVFPNARNRAQQTPLHLAARQGHAAIVEALLQYGANPNLPEKFMSYTPLRWAVQERHTDVVELLLRGGADVSEEGGKLLERARRNDDTATVVLLRQHGARSWDEDFAEKFEAGSDAAGAVRKGQKIAVPPSDRAEFALAQQEAAESERRAKPLRRSEAPQRAGGSRWRPERGRDDASSPLFIHPLSEADTDLAPRRAAARAGPAPPPGHGAPSPPASPAAAQHPHQQPRTPSNGDADLQALIDAWPDLPLTARAGIMAMVYAAREEAAKRHRHSLVG